MSIAVAMILGNVVGAVISLIILRYYFKKLGILEKKKQPVAN